MFSIWIAAGSRLEDLDKMDLKGESDEEKEDGKLDV